ncbi:hypothetical protein SETIT_5G315000v2 [Setaria italica]|uniref:Uncharacterized protein n=1 Tax=Setaria italica TaxID=4555 RepID=A0A368RAT9_SETIT|nr:hypothetical protein SETIT_5G315000v2 [Setaria italica]
MPAGEELTNGTERKGMGRDWGWRRCSLLEGEGKRHDEQEEERRAAGRVWRRRARWRTRRWSSRRRGRGVDEGHVFTQGIRMEEDGRAEVEDGDEEARSKTT